MIPEEVGNWLLLWQPEQDLTAIFKFDWADTAVLREAVTFLLTTHMDAINGLDIDVLDDVNFLRVKMLIASNPETPNAVLEYLAKRSGPCVLERIAENPNTPASVLEDLAGSDWPNVRSAVAENSHSPADLIKDLSGDENPDIRYTVAENAGTPIEVLQLLELDENPYVSHRAHTTLSRLSGGFVQQGNFRQDSRRGLNARPAY
jgi:hypothetical protein